MDAEQGNVVLTSSDDVSFTVSRSVAGLSKIVHSVFEEKEDDDQVSFPLPNVKSQTLEKVIKYCEHYVQEPMTEIEKPLKSATMDGVVQEWYATFVDMEQVELFDLVLAANYMDIKPLLDLVCATVASFIKGKTPEEIRSKFNIANDFSPEEEEQIRQQNKWVEEA